MAEEELERRAMYNLLRMNAQQGTIDGVEEWQIEDYREWSLEDLLDALCEFDSKINESRFLRYAEQCDTPEELTGCFTEEDAEPSEEDQVYLLVFELWRRLLPDSPSLSIFCDELDHIIWNYDAEADEDDEAVQDGLANLIELLDDQLDEGDDPHELFDSVTSHCATDLESFVYDYMAEQFDSDNAEYASELLDSFSPYMKDQRWCDFLHARLLAETDINSANDLLWGIFHDSENTPDLELNLELLGFLIHTGDRELFKKVAAQTTTLLTNDEDLTDLLDCTANFYQCLDLESHAKAIENLIEEASNRNPTDPIRTNDPLVGALLTHLS